ncbi:MAG: Zn-ribbon domain-containing OB-fold protein [Nitrososphaerota archaeon]|nr:Zn-ribbon domain-containing OB-fold protein [Nitrososphaerales archaeon]MDW8044383.1 Zn-ribbon domain-containing OB-fold protein [Nitrososphaerota archaeon]
MSGRDASVKSFYEFIKEGKLMATRCLRCGYINLPPRQICQACNSKDWEWFQLKGKGKLETYTIIYTPPNKFKELAPYIVGIVRLAEGPAITAIIKSKLDEVKIGLDLVADYMDYKGEKILCFKVEGSVS